MAAPRLLLAPLVALTPTHCQVPRLAQHAPLASLQAKAPPLLQLALQVLLPALPALHPLVTGALLAAIQALVFPAPTPVYMASCLLPRRAGLFLPSIRVLPAQGTRRATGAPPIPSATALIQFALQQLFI